MTPGMPPHVPFRTQHGMVIYLRPDTIIRTDHGTSTALGMLVGEHGMHEHAGGSMQVVRMNLQVQEQL